MAEYKFSDVSALMNEQAKQLLGVEDLVAEDLSNLVDVNKSLTEDTRIKMWRGMCVTGVKIIIEDKMESLPFPELFKTNDEWKAFMEKINVCVPECVEATNLNKTSGTDFSAEEHTFYAPEIEVQFWDMPEASFKVRYSIDNTKVDLEKVFNSPEELTAYYSAQQHAAEKCINRRLSAISRDAIADLALKSLAAGKYIKLLNKYNTEELDPTADDYTPLYRHNCWKDMNFVGFALYELGLIPEKFKTVSTNNNIAGMEQLTLDGDFRLILLTDFEQKIKAFYNPMVKNDGRDIATLPEHKTTYFWQAQGDGSMKDRAEMAMIDNGDTVSADYVLGLAFDKRAVAIHNENRKSTSSYTASGDFTNFFTTVICKGVLDLTENSTVILLGDDPEVGD